MTNPWKRAVVALTTATMTFLAGFGLLSVLLLRRWVRQSEQEPLDLAKVKFTQLKAATTAAAEAWASAIEAAEAANAARAGNAAGAGKKTAGVGEASPLPA